MEAIKYGSLGLWLALVVAALRFSLFQTIDGKNLRSLTRDNMALGYQVVSLQTNLAERDARISTMEQFIDTGIG